eukprot:4015688-Heterocapsa_arctica.AAC.1
MLQILWFVVKGVQEERLTKEHTHFAFEWPRWSSGWGLNILTKLSGVLKHEGNFDGCAYGLQDQRGSLRKPWKVITTLPTLAAALGKRCDGAHRHAVCSATIAKTTAYYTPSLVQAIGRSVLH